MLAAELNDLRNLVITIGVVLAILFLLGILFLRRGGRLSTRFGNVETTMESVGRAVNHRHSDDPPLVEKVTMMTEALPEMRGAQAEIREKMQALHTELSDHINTEDRRLEGFEVATVKLGEHVEQLAGVVASLDHSVHEVMDFVTRPRSETHTVTNGGTPT